ncbi:hypothetical protein Psesu_1123 [Pseudoxanthomonas suwonensis 11-1]|uniref:Uncharacterized protein n=1 Tax=Pseudoxanthomonas suwonensis (strain 11-1) TaxID=743721 RepID=E6WS24_PSEUU|nr:hypothetical protein [Pseudoxanthomonas suwonensis]ADV26973.1 hypothetical protein Psesu_1123 [Pseudoxanthomonas suwonensis 11-1]
MGRRRTKNLDLPRRVTRDPRTGALRYKRPDNGSTIYLSTLAEEVALRLAELLNEAFGPVAPRGGKYIYRQSFMSYPWGKADPELLRIVAVRMPDLLPMQRRLSEQEQIRHSWAYTPPPAQALRTGLRPARPEAGWIRPLYLAAKKNAAARGLPFELQIEDVEQMVKSSGGRCAVTGIALSVDRGTLPPGRKMRRPWAPSIDRIDSALGYTRENCRIVCCAANYAMSQWGEDVLVEMAKAIARKRIARLDKVATRLQ